MSQKIKLTAAAIRTTPLDIEGNTAKIIDAVKKDIDSAVILFPELCISGYSCEDVFYNSWLWEDSFKSLLSILPFTDDKVVVVGLPVFKSPYLYNCAAILFNQKIIGLVPKIHLANTGIHYEKRWFKESDFANDTIVINQIEYPFGNSLFDFNGIKIGIEVCEDSWVSERTSNSFAIDGAEIILSPGASHFALGKHEQRKQIFKESSRSQNNVFIFSNLIGNESGKVLFDGGCMIHSCGELIAESNRFGFKDYETVSAIIDIDALHSNKAKFFHRYKHRSFQHATIKSASLHSIAGPISGILENEKSNIYNEFTSAVAMGIFDYLIKSRCNGLTISLSGGADSAACLLLVSAMIHKAKEELGENFFKQIKLTEPSFVHTIYQKTKNNSSTTQEIASALSQDYGFKHFTIQIDQIIESNINLIKSITERNLTWEEDDITLQNIQSRTRAPLVWLLANMYNHLLISTGNRSEAATGYMTMDGDTAGSFSPIAGVSKEFILRWLRYVAEGKEPSIKPANSILKLLNTHSSAELRPLAMNQEDEKDLMPYVLLQKIEKEFILNGKGAEEIIELIHGEFKEYTLAEITTMVNKFIQLFKKSQWKREKLSPPFHLDEYGLDPKSSYRFPIFSKG